MIALLNNKTFVQNAEFPEFWPVGYTPMFLNVSPVRGKILGYSLLKSKSVVSILHGPKQPSTAFTTHIPIHKSETWAGMELNTKGDIIIAAVQSGGEKIDNGGGRSMQFTKMCAYSVPNDPQAKELTPIFAKAFEQPEFERV